MEAGGRNGEHGTPRLSRADVERRRRLLHRALPAAAVFLVALFAIASLIGAGPGRSEQRTAARYAADWSRGDYAAMYALLTPAARTRIDARAFERAYEASAETATLRDLDVGEVGARHGGAIPVALTLHTRIFGTLHGTLELPVSGSGEQMRIGWRATMTFPGVQPGERLTRTTTLPPRATLLARDGTVLAQGEQRTPAAGAEDIAEQIVGHLGPAATNEQHALRALGYPDGALVGASGLERALQNAVAGRPGGTLLAGARVLAQSRPRAARPLRTTIDPGVERAAIAALAGRYGGVAALAPQTGEVLALAGVAFSALQPPGSTFKIVTLTGVLGAHLAKPTTSFPVQTEAQLEGVALENANGEYCGGTLVQSFARSCNSVFAPLGAQLGARRLVDVAQRFGFNAPPAIPGEAASTIPAASDIGDALAVGSSAIGQGLVEATTLQMTTVAATIAMRGRRPTPTLQRGATPRFTQATRPAVAREVARMMRAVVQYGTGTAAAIAGVDVAGKTGTAELADTVAPDDQTTATPTNDDPAPPKPDIPDTDAWFVGYAPAQHPRIVVGVLLVEAGAGGDVAAPAARPVLLAGLQRKRGS